MNQNTQLFKGALTTIVLSMLKENGRMYGYELTKKVKEISNDKVNITEGALYPALHKLEAEGLLDVTIEMVDNRPRKYYALTTKGKKESGARLQEFADFFQQMSGILNLQLKLK